ncbi:MAG TPA: 30S ribosomal protein S5 [Candidatus Paceibacterota bacterium]
MSEQPEIKKNGVVAPTTRLPKNVFHRHGRGQTRDSRVKSEFDQKTLEVRRVTRVVAGGKRFNFSVALAIGNRKGSVGVGLGKGADTALAIDKATRDAKKNLIKINLTKNNSIAHRVEAKYSSAIVMLQPSPGRGIIAGSAVRIIIELVGIKSVVGKIFSGSKNKLNIARATLKALSELPTSQNHAIS